MTERSEGSMLPIVGNLTSELLDEFDPDFVKWMIASLAVKGGEEVLAVRRAIAESSKFKRTANAALHAVKQTNEAAIAGKIPGHSDGSGESSLLILCLVAGWKLCERAMTKVAERTVT